MLSPMTRQTDTQTPGVTVEEALDRLRQEGRDHPSVTQGIALARGHHTPRRALEDHVLAASRPRPVDPDVAAEQRLRLRREEAQRRFDTVGLPRATRLSEVRP